ncbi:MAG: rRNA maturation RNase YbeY [Acidimicrobiia bacterium]|nr:rRNA maturation RNase YbeY [Acidimicrobiia bacterium]
MTASAVRVEVSNESSYTELDLGHWGQVAADTLVGEGVRRGSLDLLFVDAQRMAELNREHMGKTGPTDVLSFPLDDPFESTEATLDGADDLGPLPLHVGDVVVCPTVADEQAPDHCGDFTAELTLLIVHGVLHVLGHDHGEPGESAIMMEREAVHLARCGLTHPGPASS